MAITFDSRVRLRGVNPFILVTKAQVRLLRRGWRRTLPVTVRLNGRATPAWRTNLMPVGDGRFFLYLHGAMRKTGRTSVGDRVRIALRFDPLYRGGPQQPAPSWFTRALRANDQVRKGWTELPPSRKKEIIRYIVRLKSDKARARNLARVLPVLSGHPGRYMGRDWSEGS